MTGHFSVFAMFTKVVWEHIYTQQQIRSLSRLVVIKGCKMRAVCPVHTNIGCSWMATAVSVY